MEGGRKAGGRRAAGGSCGAMLLRLLLPLLLGMLGVLPLLLRVVLPMLALLGAHAAAIDGVSVLQMLLLGVQPMLLGYCCGYYWGVLLPLLPVLAE